MKTLTEILENIQSQSPDIIASLSRFKKNGDYIRSCWGSSCYSEEIFGNDNIKQLSIKRDKARDILAPQWADNCEAWVSLCNEGIHYSKEHYAKARCSECRLAYKKHLEKINRFYNLWGKIPTLIWDKTGLIFKEEQSEAKEKPALKNKTSYCLDDFVYNSDYVKTKTSYWTKE